MTILWIEGGVLAFLFALCFAIAVASTEPKMRFFTAMTPVTLAASGLLFAIAAGWKP